DDSTKETAAARRDPPRGAPPGPPLARLPTGRARRAAARGGGSDMRTSRALLLALGAAAAGGWLYQRRPPRRGDFRFDGRVVLVTGGSRGLGLILARKLTSRGARVAICARDEAELARARDDVARYGAEPLVVACDVADAGDARRCVARVEDALGPIDVLVNNAGRIVVGPESSMTIEDYRRTMDVNFFGAVHVTDAVLPSMRRRREGRI